MSLTAGSRLGLYEILAPIGAGGMGKVYRARDERSTKPGVVLLVVAALAAGCLAGRALFEPAADPLWFTCLTSLVPAVAVFA